MAKNPVYDFDLETGVSTYYLNEPADRTKILETTIDVFKKFYETPFTGGMKLCKLDGCIEVDCQYDKIDTVSVSDLIEVGDTIYETLENIADTLYSWDYDEFIEDYIDDCIDDYEDEDEARYDAEEIADEVSGEVNDLVMGIYGFLDNPDDYVFDNHTKFVL